MKFARFSAVLLTIGGLTLAGCQSAADDPADDAAMDTLAADTTAAASLYDRLGGEPAIRSVVDTMVARAAADPELNFTRQGTENEWEATPDNVQLLKDRLVQFVGHATGGPLAYQGQDMAAAHEGMAITNEEFNLLGAHLEAALDIHQVPVGEHEELMGIVETTRGAIVTAPADSAP